MRKLLLLVLFVASTAQAADNRIAMIGVGSSDESCVDWLSARRYKDKNVQNVYVSWMQGMLTGFNTGALDLGGVSISLPSHTNLIERMDQACKEEPKQALFSVGLAIFFSMRRAQSR